MRQLGHKVPRLLSQDKASVPGVGWIRQSESLLLVEATWISTSEASSLGLNEGH